MEGPDGVVVAMSRSRSRKRSNSNQARIGLLAGLGVEVAEKVRHSTARTIRQKIL
jgi:hypothetical protein